MMVMPVALPVNLQASVALVSAAGAMEASCALLGFQGSGYGLCLDTGQQTEQNGL